MGLLSRMLDGFAGWILWNGAILAFLLAAAILGCLLVIAVKL
jgi:hypothetical protein